MTEQQQQAIPPQETNPAPTDNPPTQQQTNTVPVPNSTPPPAQQHTPQSATNSGQDGALASTLAQMSQVLQGMPERIVDSLRESNSAPQQPQQQQQAGQQQAGQQQQQQQAQQLADQQQQQQQQDTGAEPKTSKFAKWWFS